MNKPSRLGAPSTWLSIKTKYQNIYLQANFIERF